MVGINTKDDAGVYKLNNETALIQTMDFFTPMVDDAYTFGQIAAVNALNDVYAMGGKPLLAMNIVCYPKCEDMETLKQILLGGLDKIKEAEAHLVGGHTIDDNEPKYGLSVTGLVHPDKLITNSKAQVSDVLFLTKPIGNGIISTAIKAELASIEVEQNAIKWMCQLSKKATEAMQEIMPNAATDVTGFGFLGHLYEIAIASDVKIEVYSDKVPFMKGAKEFANMGMVPGGAYSNKEYLKELVVFSENVDVATQDLLFSPETAGGLIICVNEENAFVFEKEMKKRKCEYHMVGRVVDKGFSKIKVK